MSSSLRPRRSARIARVAAGLIVSVIFLFPVIVMVAGSLRHPGPPSRGVPLPPWPPAMENFAASMDMAGLARGFRNSLLVVAMFVPASVVVASMAGLAIARMDARRRARWVGISMVAFLVPVTLVMIGRFTLFKVTGANGTFLPLIAPALLGGSPLFVLVYVWAFLRIPPALFDAAEMEGAGALRLWRRVAIPMVWPASAAVAILAFFLSWSDLLGPLMYLSDPDTVTLPLSLRVLAGVDSSHTPVLLAGAVLATIPVLLALGTFHAILPKVVRRTSR